MTARSYPVPALEKGLDLLEALGAQSDPLTLTALARAVGRNNNEIYRMLNCLEERGYVVRDAAGGYRLSLLLFSLTHRQNPVRTLIECAAGEMRELSLQTGESCHLALLEGSELVVIHRNESPRPIRLAVEVGGRFPAIFTVSGRLLLSALQPVVMETRLQKDPHWQKLGKSARKAFLLRLEDIRQTGVSSAVSETVEGVVDVAVSCGQPGTPLHASLAISSLSPSKGRPDTRNLAAALKKAAAAISRTPGVFSTRADETGG